MKKNSNIWLAVATVIPVVLLFWPFAMWNDSVSVILRVIPSFAVQVLLFRLGKWNILKVLPVLIAGAFAAWGTFLYFTSPHWINATCWDLLADYMSPFLSCLIALFFCKLQMIKN